jgi:adenine-specific DNA-methyltransferase
MEKVGPSIVAARRKELGAFYTPPAMAQKLVRWALRASSDRVLDPGFGGLVFLGSAHDRLIELGATPAQARAQIFGSELDDLAHAAGLREERFAGSEHRLLCGDFLSFEPGQELPVVEAVVGNPPYVRYQGFNGRGTRGHDLAAVAGVRLTRLASSWAPFVVHATAFVQFGGRMAQVLPAEILHAQYADAVLAFLRRSFASVTVVLFEERVFPGALEEVVLLFAEGRGGGPSGQVRVVDCVDLEGFEVDRLLDPVATAHERDVDANHSLLVQLLPPDARDLYYELAQSQELSALGELASVDIGAVTGANDFFLVRGDDGRVPVQFLRPTVSKAAHVRGARLTTVDIRDLTSAGKPMHMLTVDPAHPCDDLSDLEQYLEFGRQGGVPERYKCRVRAPWWAVPLPTHGVPDAFMTYCSSEHPRLVLNEAGALHTNTVHGLKMRDGTDQVLLAAGFINSLTLLSCELVGRSYGGGVLKLEPTEAESVLVPNIPVELRERLPEIDRLLREGQLSQVLDVVDRHVLADAGLGLSADQIMLLRAAGEKLRARRRARGRTPRAG